MDRTTHSSLFLHMAVRHAQGIHNVGGEKDHKAYLSPKLFDAHLTPLGWEQVDCLRKHVNESGLLKRIELVITSLLLRCSLPTCEASKLHHHADSWPISVPSGFHGVHPCDKWRSIDEYRHLFPAIDFSLIESDEDVLWKTDEREPNDEVAARGMKFIDWLWTRKEKQIAVVTHSGFLFHILRMFAYDCHPKIKDVIGKHCNNCELRSMALADRSMIGSGSSNSNYPGKIPRSPDLPSDAAHEQHPEKYYSADRPLLMLE